MRFSRLFEFLALALPAVVALLLPAAPAEASKAVIIEVYQNCRLTDTSVVIGTGALSPSEDAEVKARVAVASKDPRASVAKIAQILKNHGIDDIKVSRQGFQGCEPVTSGKYVEAIGTYCGAKLRHAEVLVDRKHFMTKTDPRTSFAEFLDQAVRRLRAHGIYDRPMVSIDNAPDCDKKSS